MVLVAAVVVTAFSGCDRGFTETEADGYRTLTVENDLCSFVMEYSAYYERVGPRTDLDYIRPFMYVTLAAPEKRMQLLFPSDKDNLETMTFTYVPATIGVDVYDPSNSPTTSQNAKERIENDIGDNASWDNFELLERIPITVSGVEGELIAYVVDWFIPIPRGEGPLLQYHRAVYFDYNGLIWEIEAECEIEMVDQVKADFEHILETFRFLD